MKPLFQRVFVVGISLLFVTAIASSKAALSKLLISGGKLAQPIEVADRELLQSSNPWFGSFIPAWNQTSDARIADPPEAAPHYEISFDAAFSPKEPPHIIYVAYYAFDLATHRGFIYLPGPHEPGYWKNVGTIISRPHQDGRWNVANPAWCDQINAIVSRSGHYQPDLSH